MTEQMVAPENLTTAPQDESSGKSALIPGTVAETGKRVIGIIGVIFVLFAPILGASGYLTRMIMLVAVLSLMTSGLNIVLGYAGELSVSQVFLYAAGAYMTAYLAVSREITEVLIVIPIVIIFAVVIGLISGIPGLRLGGWSLAMVSFFMVLSIPSFVTVLEKYTNGTLGLSLPLPEFFGTTLDEQGTYLLVVGIALLWFAVARNLILSRHGNALLVLRQSPILASSIGISVFRLKLIVYVLGAIPCALAGAAFAWIDGFVSPDTFTFTLALSVLAASVFGGSNSIYGAIFGAAILEVGKQSLTGFQEWELIVYGIFLIVVCIVFRDGVAGLVKLALTRLKQWNVIGTRRRAIAETDAVTDITLPGTELRCEGVSKNFGGIHALEDVTLAARPGEVTGLIGPNGSGKTTLLNIICGYYAPSEGSVSFGGKKLTGSRSYQVARAGLARTFQTPIVTHGMTTLDFVSTGRFVNKSASMLASILRLPSFWSTVRHDDAASMSLLRVLGIESVAYIQVDALPLGTRRLAEVARTLASGAGAYLFDEVASGLDEADLERLKQAILRIRDAGGTVILVEHNFPLVLELSDQIHVLSRGAVLASGSPTEIQENPSVLAEYVGSSSRNAN